MLHIQIEKIMFKLICNLLLATLLLMPVAQAKMVTVVKETTGTGPTQHQAISEALLIAVQSVNGTSVSSAVNYEETVSMSITANKWSYTGKVSPVFSVNSTGEGSVSRFQVLRVSGSKGSYRAKVRAYVNQFQSVVRDQHLQRIAVMPFTIKWQGLQDAYDLQDEILDALDVQLSQSGALSVLDRQHLSEMATENAFIRWDGAPSEMSRIGQKLGVDYILVGKVNQLSRDSGNSMYGLNAGALQLRMNWKVIEVNTSKIAAAGQINRRLGTTSGQNLMSDELEAGISDQIATALAQDVLSGLKLRTATVVNKGNGEMVDTSPGYDMTPGSSDQPVKW